MTIITTTITITDNDDGSVELGMKTDLPEGADLTNGIKLAGSMVKAGDALMREHQFEASDEQ